MKAHALSEVVVRDAGVSNFDWLRPRLVEVFRGLHQGGGLAEEFAHLLVLYLPVLELVWHDQKLPILEDWIVLSLVDGDLLNGALVRVTTHGPIYGHDFVPPVKVAEVLEESLEDVKRSLKLIVKVVEEECHQNVEGVGGHVGCVRPEQCCIEGEPTLEHEDGLLQKVVLAYQLSELLNEIESEEASELADADVDGGASDFEFFL